MHTVNTEQYQDFFFKCPLENGTYMLGLCLSVLYNSLEFLQFLSALGLLGYVTSD